jgi:Glycosyl transferases group 1
VIEAMVCGTPVIAFPFGLLPELIEPGVNGALVESIEQAVAAVEGLPALDRTLCRRSFEERFTTDRMARDYVGVDEALANEQVLSAGGAELPGSGIPITVPLPVAVEKGLVLPPLATEERQPTGRADQAGAAGS